MKSTRSNRFLGLLGRFFSASAIVMSFFGLAQAATLYYDGATTVANNQSNNATTTAQNWLSGGTWDNGTTSAARASWTAGDAAVFGGVTTASTQTITAGTLTVGNMTFGGGTAGTGTVGKAYTITGGTLTLSSSTITANTNTTISSALAGTTGLIKAGGTFLVLSGSHSGLSGTTTINAGSITMNTATNTTAIVVNSGGQFYGGWAIPGNTFANTFSISGTGWVEGGINNAAIRASNNQTFSGPITLAAASRIGMIETSAAATFSGKISGAFALNVQGAFNGNAGTQTFTLANSGVASDYTGDLSISAVDYGGARTGAKTILRLGADDQIPHGVGKGNLVLSGANADHQTIFELNGKNETINGLSNAAAAGAIIRNSVSGASVLTIGDADAVGSFSGVISDGGDGKTLTSRPHRRISPSSRCSPALLLREVMICSLPAASPTSATWAPSPSTPPAWSAGWPLRPPPS